MKFKKQHYIPKKIIDNFKNEDGKIFLHIKNKKIKEINNSKNIFFKNYFYGSFENKGNKKISELKKEIFENTIGLDLDKDNFFDDDEILENEINKKIENPFFKVIENLSNIDLKNKTLSNKEKDTIYRYFQFQKIRTPEDKKKIDKEGKNILEKQKNNLLEKYTLEINHKNKTFGNYSKEENIQILKKELNRGKGEILFYMVCLLDIKKIAEKIRHFNIYFCNPNQDFNFYLNETGYIEIENNLEYFLIILPSLIIYFSSKDKFNGMIDSTILKKEYEKSKFIVFKNRKKIF